MIDTTLTKGLFTSPLAALTTSNLGTGTEEARAINPLEAALASTDSPIYKPRDSNGSIYCDVFPNSPSCFGGGILDNGGYPTGIGPGNTSTTVIAGVPSINNITNNINIVDDGIAQVSAQVSKAIEDSVAKAAQIAKDTVDAVASGVSSLASKIWDAVTYAFGNIGDLLKSIASAVWDNLKNIISAIGDHIASLLQDLRDWIGPILKNIGDVLDAVTKQIQKINDTLIEPIANIYNTTIKTVVTLTTAIEQDLHEGIGGLLKIPGQLADQLGSLDATLNRSIQQLGTVNKETVDSSITFLGQTFPAPFSAAMASALGGKTLSSALSTTFAAKEQLTTESLGQVSQEAIRGLGTLLLEVLSLLGDGFKEAFGDLHATWASAGGIFVGLLDGILGALTAVTAIAALAEPLIDTAAEEARKLIPTKKLDPTTVINALTRKFIDNKTALSEIASSGLDATRTKVLLDLSVFLADANTALEWWYRGIIDENDLLANMRANSISDNDIVAIRAASVYVPNLAQLQRWLDFGLIDQDEFTTNCKVLHYDSAQIQALLSTYQDRESPQTLSQLHGLLGNTGAGWLNRTMLQPVPETVALAGSRAGMHPDLVRYIWLAHWQLPSVQSFIQSYFRGYRTLTEVQQRMEIENIPSELWDETINISRPLLPFRSISGYLAKGFITQVQAQEELAAHGYDLTHQQILLKAAVPTVSKTTPTAATSVHTLSIANARTLWADSALTDAQYLEILEAHGYTAEMAHAQLQADAITEHIKHQKVTLQDFTAQVETGVLSLDDASNQLLTLGFTSAQVAKFQLSVVKSLKVNTRHPSISEMKVFLKAKVITLDDFKQELQIQGWTDPWLSAFIALETPPAGV